MKCSDYLWMYIDMQNKMPGVSALEIQGRALMALGDDHIVSDVTGEPMSQVDAGSILGRNETKLRVNYADGDRDRFTQICVEQQQADMNYHAGKNDSETESK